MERKLVIKNNSLCAIYFTILNEILIRKIVLNFHIHKELFGLINLTLEIFYVFVLNQEALEIGRNDLTISDISCTLAKFVIYFLSLIKKVPS